MNKEKLLMMLKKNIDKIVITLVVFVSFLLLGRWCYHSFRSSNENEEIEVRIDNDNFEYEVKNIPESVRKDFLLFIQKLNADEKKIFKKKKVNREKVEENIEILKDQGIWDGLLFESGVNFEEYYNSTIKDSQEKFKIQLDKLLEKLEKEKNFESFYAELTELGIKHRKNANMFAEFAQRVQTEAEKPMPFFATWVGLGISIAICLIVTFIISSSKFSSISDNVKNEKKKIEKFSISDEEKNKKIQRFRSEQVSEYLLSLALLFFVIHLFSQFLIFPLIDCLLLLFLQEPSLREPYKYRFYNKFKISSLFIVPVFWFLIVALVNLLCRICCCGCCIEK